MKLPDFSSVSILVAGDLMLDTHWFCDTNKVSPEAPVLVVNKKASQNRLGGAANVAFNLASLGVQTSITGLLGQDVASNIIIEMLQQANIENVCMTAPQFSSITKLRIMSRNQQLLRIDTEGMVTDNIHADIVVKANNALKGKQTLIISDYGKTSFKDPQPLISTARKLDIPVLVDPKGDNYQKYTGATILTPNLKEFSAVVGECQTDAIIFKKAQALCLELNLNAVVVTLSERGMAIIECNKPPVHIYAQAKTISDVTGAGDTVIATLAACLSTGMTLVEAARVANLAASIIVGKLGTAATDKKELQAVMLNHSYKQPGYILDEAELLSLVTESKAKGERIVMTNGCFDLLHPGHVAYLQQAAQEGDRLIVAVNDDQSVRRLKGEKRPLNPLEDRIKMLTAIKGVDWVCRFSEDTPRRLIAKILPDLLIKGGDYRPENIAGYNEVIQAGGEVKVLNLLDNYSSTLLIERAKAS